jgi:amino acid transporter
MPQAIGEVAELNDARLLAKIVASTVIAGGLFYASVILATSFAAPYAILDGAELGVATAMEFAFKSHWMGKVVLLTGLLGLLTTWNAVFYCATRVLFALGRAKLIHPNLGRTHDRHGSPHLAVLLVGSICILGGLAGRPALLIVINSAALGFSIVYFIACCAMVRIRQLRPDAERPFRLFGYPWLCILAIGYVGLMVVFTLYFSWIERQTLIPMEWTLAAAWIVVGFITWFGSHRVRNRISEEERRELLHTR